MSVATQRAAADVAAWREDPSALDRLQLGAFEEAPLGQVVAVRALLALRVPPWVAARFLPPRVVHAYRYWRAVRGAVDRDAWRRLTQGPTILMYHAIARDGEHSSRFVLPRRAFERQMRWLARRRPVLGLDELLAYRRSHRLPPPRTVVVTIDDGYDDARTAAHPVLERHSVQATLFVVTGRMGRPSGWNTSPELEGRPVVSWDDARALHGGNIALGAHTRTHPVLPELPSERLDNEIAGSRADLADALGEPVETFAYPYGKVDGTVAEAVQRAGFGCAVSIRAGRNCAATPPFLLRRAEIHGGDSFLRFRLAVRFGDSHVDNLVRRRVNRR